MSVDDNGAAQPPVGFSFSLLPRTGWRALIHARGRLSRETKRVFLKARWALRRRKNVEPLAEAEDVMRKTGVSVINLAHRGDRIDDFSREMERLKITDWRRVEAVDGRADFPSINPFFSASIGCTLSHIAALEQADWSEKDAWIVCEDDAQFLVDRAELSLVLASFMNDPSLDVLALYGRARGGSLHIGSGLRISLGIVGRVCYVIKPHMKGVLIDEFSAGVPLMLKGIRKGKGDQMWRKLQRSRYFFATPAKTMVRNRAGFSDIEGKVLGPR